MAPIDLYTNVAGGDFSTVRYVLTVRDGSGGANRTNSTDVVSASAGKFFVEQSSGEISIRVLAAGSYTASTTKQHPLSLPLRCPHQRLCLCAAPVNAHGDDRRRSCNGKHRRQLRCPEAARWVWVVLLPERTALTEARRCGVVLRRSWRRRTARG